MEHSQEFLELAETAQSRVTEISVAEARAKVEGGTPLIDVREDNEFAANDHRPEHAQDDFNADSVFAKLKSPKNDSDN